MSAALIVTADCLLDDHAARAAVVAWAVGAYPAVHTGAISAPRVASLVTDAEVTDEAVVTHLLCDHLGALSADVVELELVRLLLKERRHGATLYRQCFGAEPLYWFGEGALQWVTGRAVVLPPADSLVVVSPKSRVELMTTLMATGWAERAAWVVSGDEVVGDDAAHELLACARERCLGASDVRLYTGVASFRHAAEGLGLAVVSGQVLSPLRPDCRSASMRSRT